MSCTNRSQQCSLEKWMKLGNKRLKPEKDEVMKMKDKRHKELDSRAPIVSKEE